MYLATVPALAQEFKLEKVCRLFPTTVGISGKQQKGCYKKMPQTVVVFYDKLEDAFINAAGGIGELDSSSSATVFF
jgi:hypothetical protein